MAPIQEGQIVRESDQLGTRDETGLFQSTRIGLGKKLLVLWLITGVSWPRFTVAGPHRLRTDFPSLRPLMRPLALLAYYSQPALAVSICVLTLALV